MQGGASLLVQLVDPLLGVRGALEQLAQLLLVPVTGQLESEKYIRLHLAFPTALIYSCTLFCCLCLGARPLDESQSHISYHIYIHSDSLHTLYFVFLLPLILIEFSSCIENKDNRRR